MKYSTAKPVRFQVDDLLVEHRVEDDGTLWIQFQGSFLGNYNKDFEIYRAYLEQVVELTTDGAIAEAHLHFDALGQMISRAKHTIFGMLQGLRQRVPKIVIYVGSGKPELEEHQRMMRLYIQETSAQDGASLDLVVV